MASLKENIAQAISDFDDIQAAIEEQGIAVPKGTDTKEYGNLIRGIAGSSVIVSGSGEKSAVQGDTENNKALSDYSMALGTNTQAGSKAFLITACDQTNKTFTLDSTEGLAVGDVYSISASGYANVEDIGEITAINGNVVTVEHLPVETDENGNKVKYGNAQTNSDELPENFPEGLAAPYFRITAKPNVGTQEIGEAALATGNSTQAQMDTSFTTGNKNYAKGKYAVAMGQNNQAYYNAVAIGSGNVAFGKTSTALGNKNKTNGWADCAAGGQNNTSSGGCCLTAGSWNTAEGFNSVAFGLYTTAQGQNAIATGYRNVTNGYCSASFGAQNTNNGTQTFVTGQNNKVNNTQNVFVTGQNNKALYTQGAILAGNSNNIDGENTTNKLILRPVALGQSNTVTGDYGVALGYHNKAGTQSFSVGADNEAGEWLTATIGKGLQCNQYNNQMAVGTYNKEQAGAFIVGNGTSDTERSNAFVVNKDGSAEVAKQGTKDNSVVTVSTLKQYKKGSSITPADSATAPTVNLTVDETNVDIIKRFANTLTSLTIQQGSGSTMSLDQSLRLIFKATASTTITVPTGLYFRGDDCNANYILIPKSDKVYDIIITYDGFNYNGVVVATPATRS